MAANSSQKRGKKATSPKSADGKTKKRPRSYASAGGAVYGRSAVLELTTAPKYSVVAEARLERRKDQSNRRQMKRPWRRPLPTHQRFRPPADNGLFRIVIALPRTGVNGPQMPAW